MQYLSIRIQYTYNTIVSTKLALEKF